jgi:hypothetical protein
LRHRLSFSWQRPGDAVHRLGAALLQDIRWHAPAPVFQAILDAVRPHLTPREWEKLATALAIA